jgi:uncharacterized protein YyaL (SSP411 family)
LVHQASPYLQQHAYNPVDWWPWSQQAIDAARQQDRPIFLSIGYSTCYWCHVMERECFEDPDIGAELSKHFLCIKVDREERPDLDDLYMAATLAMLGRGGWPMNVLLDPHSLRPFWCGTYIPPTPRPGMPGIRQVIAGLSHAWNTQRSEVLEQSKHLAEVVAAQLAAYSAPVSLTPEPIAEAVSTLLKMLDRTHGGFGRAPKFPQPVFLQFLLDARPVVDDSSRAAIDDALTLTLHRMATGGIHDHLAGGFHRYSVDAHWLVPHFEKMLYDQAQLAQVYAHACVAYSNPRYRHIAETTLTCVQQELTLSNGLFCSAIDAEVDHREGLNYLWTVDQVQAALSPADAAIAIRLYGLDKGPNFRDPHHPDDPASNILFLAADAPAIDDSTFQRIRSTLLAARNQRKQPHRDDKVISSWNALMIAAYADCGRLLVDPALIATARSALDALLAAHLDSSGNLFRVSRPAHHAPASTPALLEDFAALTLACQAVHRADPSAIPAPHPALIHAPSFDALANQLLDQAHERFADSTGIPFDTRADQSDLFLRGRSLHDGAVPCATSMLLNALHAAAAHHIPASDWLLTSMASLSSALVDAPVNHINSARCLLHILTGENPALIAALATLGPAKQSAAQDVDSPVQIFASTDRVSLSTSEPGLFNLILRIAPGFHILAADPGPSGTSLFPLRIATTSGTGVTAYADYPAGTPSATDPNLLIHTGQIEFQVVLERSGEWSGRPILTATFQACTDTECHRATTVELDVALDRAD